MALLALTWPLAVTAIIWALTNHVLDERLYRKRCWRESMGTTEIRAGAYRSTRVPRSLVRAPFLVRVTAFVLYLVGIPAFLVLGAVVVVVTVRSLFTAGRSAEFRALPLLTYGLGTKLLAREPSVPDAVGQLVGYWGVFAVACVVGMALGWRLGMLAVAIFGTPCALALVLVGLLLATMRRHGHLFAKEVHLG